MWARVVEHDLRTNGLSVSSVYRTGDEACPTLYAARTLSHRESRRSVFFSPRLRRQRVCSSQYYFLRSEYQFLRMPGPVSQFLRMPGPVSQFLKNAKKLRQNPVLSF